MLRQILCSWLAITFSDAVALNSDQCGMTMEYDSVAMKHAEVINGKSRRRENTEFVQENSAAIDVWRIGDF